jgi:hypothetical protein
MFGRKRQGLSKLFKSCKEALTYSHEEIASYEPRILLVGADGSGKDELSSVYANNPRYSMSSSENSRSAFVKTKISTQPLLDYDSSSKEDSNDGPTERIVGYYGQFSRDSSSSEGSASSAMIETRPRFENVLTSMVNLPAEARFDAKFLKAQRAGICFFVAMDTFDQWDEQEGKSILAIEMESLAHLQKAMKSTKGAIAIVLSNLDKFAAKLEIGGIKAFCRAFPDFVCPSSNPCTQELVRLVIEYLQAKIAAWDYPGSLYCYNVRNIDQVEVKIAQFVRTVYLEDVLLMAGFMS